MPTYDYKCAACSHQFELFESIKAKPAKKCPACGGKVKRLPGTGGLILFKGSGFYETDYKRKSTQAASTSDTAASSTTTTPSPTSPTSPTSQTSQTNQTTPSAPTTPSTPPPAKGGKK
jgi:putative FmdB family regulatory protein